MCITWNSSSHVRRMEKRLGLCFLGCILNFCLGANGKLFFCQKPGLKFYYFTVNLEGARKMSLVFGHNASLDAQTQELCVFRGITCHVSSQAVVEMHKALKVIESLNE